jgi:hypothetical protein
MSTTKINYLYIIIIGLFLFLNCFASSDSELPYKEGELLVQFAPKANGKQEISVASVNSVAILKFKNP